MHIQKIFFCALFITTYSKSIIVTAEQLDGNKNKPCNHYIYYDVHTWPARDEEKNQIIALSEHLAKREEIESDNVEILVEQPLSVVQMFDQKPRVLSSLGSIIKEKKLIKTSIESIEIRCAALEALFILQKGIDPRYIFPKLAFVNNNIRHVVEKLTFNDLIEEYNIHKNRLNDFIQSMHKYEPSLSKEMDMLSIYFDNFRKDLKQHDLDEDSSILEYAKKLKNKFDDKTRENLWNSISLPFSRLFDINAFSKMYNSLQNSKKVMLIAGWMHALQVSQMLRATGMESAKLHSNGYTPYEESISPLDNNQLNLFKRDSSWLKSCIIC